jgi:hypothetical protein
VRRIGNADARAEVCRVVSYPGICNCVTAIIIAHDSGFQIEVANPSADWRKDFIAQAEIEGKTLDHMPVVLNERIDFLVVCLVHAGQTVLKLARRDAEQQVSDGVAAIRCRQVLGVLAGKGESTKGRLRLIEITGKKAPVSAELNRATILDPGNVVRNLISVVGRNFRNIV